MANEITIRGILAYDKGDADAFDKGEILVTMTGTKTQRGRQTVTTAEEALIIGEVVIASAWFICQNKDATNKLLIKPAAGTSIMVEVQPGETCGPFRFASTLAAPFVQSSAGSVDFIYLLVQT